MFVLAIFQHPNLNVSDSSLDFEQNQLKATNNYENLNLKLIISNGLLYLLSVIHISIFMRNNNNYQHLHFVNV